MTHLVSILIPSYNAEPWIMETIESALSQTWNNKEVIIVDDGSTDATLKIAKTYESHSVKVVTQYNRGANAARNRALEFAQGDYIQWLDADDLLAPDKIALQMQAAHAGGSTTLLSSEFGEFLADPRKATFRAHSLWQNLSPIDFLLRKFTENVWMHRAAWLVSRGITETAGPWDKRLSLDDDGEYFARIVAASQRINFVPAARSYYRRGNVGSLSRSLSESACESLLLSLRLCIGHLRSLEDSERARAASITLLQNWTDLGDCFYPDNDAYGAFRSWRTNWAAPSGLPRLSWKYVPIQWAFGWGTAKRAKVTVSNLKLVARLHFDRFSLAASRRQPSEFLP